MEIQVDQLKPGRRMDAEVARAVFKGKVVEFKSGFGRVDYHTLDHNGAYTLVPTYSTHIASAWMLMEHLKMCEPEVGWSDEQHVWICTLRKGRQSGVGFSADTAPHAICLAALAAQTDPT